MKAKTVIDAVNHFKGVWPDKNRKELVTTSDKWNGEKEVVGVIEIRLVFDRGDNSEHCISENDWAILCDITEFNQCVEDCSNNKGWDNIKAVYTKAMCDAGELPCVGMECTYGDTTVTVNYIATSFLVVQGVDLEFTVSKKSALHELKPIDVRSDVDKAIDDILYHKLAINRGIAESIVKAIVGGDKIHGVTWSKS